MRRRCRHHGLPQKVFFQWAIRSFLQVASRRRWEPWPRGVDRACVEEVAEAHYRVGCREGKRRRRDRDDTGRLVGYPVGIGGVGGVGGIGDGVVFGFEVAVFFVAVGEEAALGGVGGAFAFGRVGGEVLTPGGYGGGDFFVAFGEVVVEAAPVDVGSFQLLVVVLDEVRENQHDLLFPNKVEQFQQRRIDKIVPHAILRVELHDLLQQRVPRDVPEIKIILGRQNTPEKPQRAQLHKHLRML
mmetsp:Transcript_27346/g.68609  ORF Transcript_27346/g.68609 Transcript_27346/m.68609 type:complete len:242 (+) Transcript_27346:535-1260(+)